MPVTVSDVREFLKDLPSDFVSDAAIQKQIDLAEFIVNRENAGYATPTGLDQAILVCAAYYTAVAYASEVERSLNVLPPSLISWLEILKNMHDKILEYIRAGVPPKPVAIVKQIYVLSESLGDYTGKDEIV